MEATLSYDHTFAEKHAVSGMLLFNRRHFDKGEKLPYRTQGMAGRASYTYSGKYIGSSILDIMALKILLRENVMVFFLQGLLVGLCQKNHLCNLFVELFLN